MLNLKIISLAAQQASTEQNLNLEHETLNENI